MGHTKRLIQQVETRYGIRIRKADVIKDVKHSSFVAKLDTDSGKSFIIKTLYVPEERQQFIAASETLLYRRNVPLAKPVKMTNGERVMTWKGVPYVLYRWVNGKSGKLQNVHDLIAIVKLAAVFHKASRHLEYPAGIKRYEHPDWAEEYRRRLETLAAWEREPYDPNSERDVCIHEAIPFLRETGEEALDRLIHSSYQVYRNRPADQRTLVHGDLHHKNVLIDKDGAKLIDFEDVRYDVPSKDLLRIYSMYTKSKGFSPSDFMRMMKAYGQIHRLTPEEKELVYIDFLFPHIFERMLRKKKYIGVQPEELQFWVRQEVNKAAFFKAFFRSSQVLVKEGET